MRAKVVCYWPTTKSPKWRVDVSEIYILILIYHVIIDDLTQWFSTLGSRGDFRGVADCSANFQKMLYILVKIARSGAIRQFTFTHLTRKHKKRKDSYESTQGVKIKKILTHSLWNDC